MATEPLFTAADLGNLLGTTVDAGKHALVERVVWGWLRPILDVDARPVPVPDELFSWAIELGAIAHENPDGRTAKQIGPFKDQYSVERRKEILAEVQEHVDSNNPDGDPSAPTGYFPPPLPYPDPAGPC